MLALSAQMASLATRPGAVMILTSEREIATDRMIELAGHMLMAHDPDRRVRSRQLLDNILSNIVSDIMALDHTLSYKIPLILRDRLGQGPSPLLGQTGEYEGGKGLPIRLLIVDSITALIRGADSNYNSTSMGLTERSRHLCAVSDKLKAIALEFGLAVVVINQVSDVFTRAPVVSSTPTAPGSSPSPMLSQFYTEGPEPPTLYATQARWFSGQTDTLQKEASLGIVWANAVNTRIMLSRTGRRRMIDPKDLSRRRRRRKEVDEVEGRGTVVEPIVDETQPTLIRRAHVVFSPFAAPATIDYIISPTGIHSLPDSYRLVDIAETLRRRRKLAKAIMGDEDTGSQASQPSQPVPDGTEARGQVGAEPLEDFGEEIYDDLAELPVEFWEGRMDAYQVEPLALGAET
jgi:DNA repair protein RAD57